MMGPNIAATLAVPRLCAANKAIRIITVKRHNEIAERRTCKLEPFDSRKNRNRRRDHGVAEKHRGADDTDDKDEGRAPAKGTGGERRQ